MKTQMSDSTGFAVSGNGLAGDGDGALWTVENVARYLQVSRSWVYHRAESGELPSLRIGGLLRFDPDAVRAYARGEQVGQATSLPRAAGAVRRR